MSEIIFQIDPNFPFERLSLANPHGIQGGAFFSRIIIDNEHPFFLQTPKCVTKNGIVVTDKKTYCDLMFSNDNETLLNFLQELEKHIQHLIYEKRDLWFGNPMNMENIEYFFNPILRTFKKNYLVRTYVQQPKHIKSLKSLQIYDENENRLELKDVNKDKHIIAILEGLGIKFTSSSFHLELCLRQMMVMEDKPLFQKCLIQMKKPFTQHSIPNTLTKSSIIQKHTPSPKDCTQEKEDVEDIEKSKVEDPEKEDTKLKIATNTIKQDTTEKKIAVEEINRILPTSQDCSAAESISKEAEQIDAHETLEKELNEVDVQLPNEAAVVHLKEPLVVYKELYEKARQKAKEMKRAAIAAFLEAKNIKNTFLSGEIEESDDDSEFSELAE